MMLAKKAPKKRYVFQVFSTCVLIMLAILLVVTSTVVAAGKPKTVAEIALYQGPGRQKMLIEGAKKEGQFMLYNSNSWITNVVSKEFGKKYPFIKVLVARMRSKRMIKRVLEEYAAGSHKVDAIETSHGSIRIFHRNGIFQEYYTPEAAHYPEEVKEKGKSGGVYFLADRELYYGLGFNTEAISSAEAPKTYKDLLDPRWKGKMSIVASGTGIRWIGSLMHVMGREYIEKLSRQNIKVQNISAAAMNTLIVAGEVPLCPTSGNTTLALAKERGAPVEWRPFTPTLTTIGLSGITTKAPNPHAAMLFLDYLHSKEGQQVVMKGKINSPRLDIGSLEQQFKKHYLDGQYPIEEYERRYNEWEGLLKQLFIRKG
jgi:iron(III) transport system substrate-binding protein